MGFKWIWDAHVGAVMQFKKAIPFRQASQATFKDLILHEYTSQTYVSLVLPDFFSSWKIQNKAKTWALLLQTQDIVNASVNWLGGHSLGHNHWRMYRNKIFTSHWNKSQEPPQCLNIFVCLKWNWNMAMENTNNMPGDGYAVWGHCLLLTIWINFTPSMHRKLHPLYIGRRNYVSNPKIQRCTVECWQWMGNLIISHFTEQVITYPCWD